MAHLLHHTIDEAASRSPAQVAFRCRGEQLTYGELETETNRLANLLIELGISPGDRVGIRLPRSLQTAICVHGISKAGGVFVPVDPMLPDAGLSQLIEDCGLSCLITNKLSPVMQGLSAVVGPNPQSDSPTPSRCLPWSELDRSSAQAPQVERAEDDLAYLMYTSGSTGRPKGIMHTHRSGLSYARLSVATYGVRESDRIGNHSPLHFDMSTFGYFAGPYASATTVIVPDEHVILPASLSQLMQEERLTIWYSVPSVLIHLLSRGALEQRDLSHLRWVKYGGEPLSVKHLRQLMSLWPQARFSNVYGPAEVNQCTYFHLPAEWSESDGPIPIGRVWEDTDGIVLDADDSPANRGDVGELAINSDTMMRGYWNQPELTARSLYHREGSTDIGKAYYRTGDLVREMEDGGYLFLGRRDRQVKTRGHRVELDDVEAALAGCESVMESAVYAVDDGEGSRVIEAAVIPEPKAELTERGLLAQARQYLPAYAVPRRIAIRSDFPRTGTGKIDRLALQNDAAHQPD